MSFVIPKLVTLCTLLLSGFAGAQTAQQGTILPAMDVAPAPAAPELPAPAPLVHVLPAPLDLARSPRQQYHLRMYHLHTGESVDVTYRVGNQYVPSAITMLNHFLRDHRTGDTADYDPHEFDVLHAIMARLHRPNGVIDIICGYRTPWSNEYLRERSDGGVAEHSQHMLSKAIDIRVPGVSTRRLDRTALSLGDGGVGYYPRSQFVHVDVGPVRKWTFR